MGCLVIFRVLPSMKHHWWRSPSDVEGSKPAQPERGRVTTAEQQASSQFLKIFCLSSNDLMFLSRRQPK